MKRIHYFDIEFRSSWKVPADTPEEAMKIVEKVIDELTPIIKKYNIQQVKQQTNN